MDGLRHWVGRSTIWAQEQSSSAYVLTVHAWDSDGPWWRKELSSSQ
jgi:hypothetical protein